MPLQPSPTFLPRSGALFSGALALVVYLVAGVCAFAQGIPSAGDKDDAWLLRKSGIDDVTIYHRNQADPKGQMVPVSVKIEGRLTDNLIAAGPSEFWMVKPSGWVESLLVDHNPLPSLPRYNAPRPQQTVPDKAKPIACAAARNGFWLLVRIDSAQDLKVFNSQLSPSTPSSPNASVPWGQDSDLPPWFVIRGLSDPASTQPAQTPATEPSPQTQQALGPELVQVPPPVFPVYRLLHLEGSFWRAYPAPLLPEPVLKESSSSGTQPSAKPGPFGMVFLNPKDAWPIIFSQVPGVGVTRHQFSAGQWVSTEIEGADAFDKAIVVDHQPVLIRAAKTSTGVSLFLGVISGNSLIDLPNQIDLAPNTGALWAALPMDNSIAIVEPLPGQAVESELDWKLSLKRINLLGKDIDGKPQTLESKPANLWNDSPNMVIFASSFFVGLLLMWSLWGRDNVETSVRLPVGVVKADLPRRAFACLIDMVPCAWVAMLVYKVEFGELFKQIIELSKSWALLKPWLMTVILLAIYSTVCEAFYGRTLGKYLAGLRVTRLDASAPGLLQVITRNAVKIIEVLCFPLMFIPVARLNAQRLGDMAARTIVVADEPPEEEDDDDFEDS